MDTKALELGDFLMCVPRGIYFAFLEGKLGESSVICDLISRTSHVVPHHECQRLETHHVRGGLLGIMVTVPHRGRGEIIGEKFKNGELHVSVLFERGQPSTTFPITEVTLCCPVS